MRAHAAKYPSAATEALTSALSSGPLARRVRSRSSVLRTIVGVPPVAMPQGYSLRQAPRVPPHSAPHGGQAARRANAAPIGPPTTPQRGRSAARRWACAPVSGAPCRARRPCPSASAANLPVRSSRQRSFLRRRRLWAMPPALHRGPAAHDGASPTMRHAPQSISARMRVESHYPFGASQPVEKGVFCGRKTPPSVPHGFGSQAGRVPRGQTIHVIQPRCVG